MADGTYTGDFDVAVDGLAGYWAEGYSEPGNRYSIVFRPAPGTRPVIDGSLKITGAYVLVSWLEGIQSDYASRDGSTATIFNAHGYRSTFRHCVGHQAQENGFGLWNGAQGADHYGLIAYNSGLTDDVQGGHNYYIQNNGLTTGETKLVRSCVSGPNGGWGFHAYSETSNNLDKITFEGCSAYGAGAIIDGHTTYHPAFLKQGVSARDFVYRRCYLWSESGKEGALVLTTGASNDRLTIEDCDLRTSGTTVSGDNLFPVTTISGNIIEGTVSATVDAGSDVYAYGAGPAAVYVEPDEFEDGRALIRIQNPSNVSTVNVDLSDVLDIGDTFAIFDAMNPIEGGAKVTGTYSGAAIAVPMTGHTFEAPLDTTGKSAPTHPTKYGDFVVLKGRSTFVAP